MAKLTNIKVKGAILLEPLVAIVIISAVLTLTALTIGNIAGGSNSFIRFKAQNTIEILASKNIDFENETYSFTDFEVEKKVLKYGDTDDVYEITWSVKLVNQKNIIVEQKQLVRK